MCEVSSYRIKFIYILTLYEYKILVENVRYLLITHCNYFTLFYINDDDALIKKTILNVFETKQNS
jgi:hypothetical protein